MLRSLVLLAAVSAFSAVNYGSLQPDTWVQQALSGGVVNQGGDVHWACDTTGNAYIFGACTYGGQAGGSHNSDVYRFNLQTGGVEMLSNASNNRLGWSSACQNGITFDRTRNCMWIGNNSSATFWKYQCPNGPLTQMAKGSGTNYQTYCVYDNVNDLVYVPDDYTLRIYNCRTNSWKAAVNWPFSAINYFDVPCCFDSKRGLFVITLAGPYGDTVTAHHCLDVWFFNGATSTWSKKTPATRPAGYQRDMAYDAVNDKYVYFGGNCPSELWLYDYDSNAWTKVAQNGRSFNDANPSASTWPPARHKHCWAYSPKYNVCANWGGGQWADAACTDYDAGSQPIWVYRLGSGTTGISSPRLRESRPRVSPNPFHACVTVFLEGPARSAIIVDPLGRRVQEWTGPAGSFVWQPRGMPGGLYLFRADMGNQSLTAPIMLK
jgi:hypothetical protein